MTLLGKIINFGVVKVFLSLVNLNNARWYNTTISWYMMQKLNKFVPMKHHLSLLWRKPYQQVKAFNNKQWLHKHLLQLSHTSHNEPAYHLKRFTPNRNTEMHRPQKQNIHSSTKGLFCCCSSIKYTKLIAHLWYWLNTRQNNNNRAAKHVTSAFN